MYMNGMDREAVVELIQSGGGRIFEIRTDDESIPGYHSLCYAVTRG
jgi:hypothetical protein